jgi:hypothetical protein
MYVIMCVGNYSGQYPLVWTLDDRHQGGGKMMREMIRLNIMAAVLALFSVILSINCLAAQEIPVGGPPQGMQESHILQPVAGQVETFTAGSAGYQVGDIVNVIRKDRVLGRAIVIQIKNNVATITIMGSSKADIVPGDLVRFESHGKRQQSASGTTQGAALTSEPVSDKELIKKNYTWIYRGVTYTCQLQMPRAALMMYKRKPRVYGDYSIYCSDPSDKEAINYLVGIFREAAAKNGLDYYETINLIIAFEQCLKYTSDKMTTGYDDYPRYPAETLADEGGDCEDTSVLLATMLQAMGLDVVMIQFPHHIGVGLALADPSSFKPPYLHRLFSDGKKTYAYLESTGHGYRIGEIVKEYENMPAEIVYLSPRALFQAENISDFFTSEQIMVKLTVHNAGTYAGECTLHVAAEVEGNATPFSQIRSDAIPLGYGQKVNITLNLKKPPVGSKARVVLTLYEGNRRTDLHKTEWFTTPEVWQ